jgi:hypothetical protein
MRGIGDPQSTPTAFYVTAGVLIVITAILGVQAFFLHSQQELERERIVEPAYREATTVQRSQDELLNSYGWSDEERTAVRIPIDEAMDLFVEEARSP